MGRRVMIEIGTLILTAKLNRTQIADAIYQALPIITAGNHWGDEIYFPIPIKAENEDPREEVEVGQLAYWPPGNALCIFFGRTPASTTHKPRAASAVTVVGHLESIPAALFRRDPPDEIRVSAAPAPNG